MSNHDKSLILLDRDSTSIGLVEQKAKHLDMAFVPVSTAEEACQKIEQSDTFCFLLNGSLLEQEVLDFGLRLKKEYPKLAFLPYLEQPEGSVGMQLLHGGARACLKSPLEAKELSYHLSKILAESMEVYNPFSVDYEERKVVIPNDFTLVMQVVKSLVHSTLPIEEKNRYHIILGLNEIINNAIEHGNLGIDYETKNQALQESKFFELAWKRIHTEPYKDRRVTVVTRVYPTQNLVEFEVEDEGDGFNWKTLPDALNKDNALRRNGRGLMIASHAFDEVHFNEKGNKVTLVYHTHKVSEG